VTANLVSTEIRRGHLRGRVTAVGQQLEFLFTTQSDPSMSWIGALEAVSLVGA
jgi:hypothetical protein